jgi:uncharacterized protein
MLIIEGAMAEAMRNLPILTQEELSGRLDELYRAIEEFNDGYFFESHETLEDLWMVTPWPERQLFQGIIQLAAAFVHYARREYPGILKLLDAAIEKVGEFTPEAFGIDAAQLVESMRRARDEFERLGEARFLDFDERLVPQISFLHATSSG